MTDECSKNGYVGFAEMGKPIPLTRRQAACEICVEYGFDAKAASEIVSKMVKFLEKNKPHEAVLSARKVTGVTITRVYKLIAYLLKNSW